MIQKATTQDIHAILEMTKACAKHMISKGIFQWNEHYPNRMVFETDLNRDELYVMKLNDNILGCIIISTIMDEEYIPIKWMTDNDKNVYIHRLAVHPKYQGRGFAQELMDFAEAYAQDKNFVSVRLDTFSQNRRNQKFFELRGYQRLGSINFPKQSEYPFYCYEYIL